MHLEKAYRASDTLCVLSNPFRLMKVLHSSGTHQFSRVVATNRESLVQMTYVSTFGAALLLQMQMTESIVKTQYLACNPERQFSRAEQLRAAGDTAGLHAFTVGALISGTCISLTPGLTVLTVGRGKAPGVIRIRPKGSFRTFFTSDLALE